MQEQLDQNQAVLDENIIIELINRIRPKNPKDADEVKQQIQGFIKILLLTLLEEIIKQFEVKNKKQEKNLPSFH